MAVLTLFVTQLPYGWLIAQLIELASKDGVTLARCRLQRFAVKNGDVTVRVLDEPRTLQGSSDDGDRLAADSEHDREKLMTDMEIFPVHPVMGFQEPSTATLLERVSCHASCCLHRLNQHDLRVTGHQIVKCAVAFYFLAESFNAHHLGVCVWHLHDRFTRCLRVCTVERFNPYHAFVADGGGLNHRAVAEYRRHGPHTAVEEVDKFNRCTVFLKHLLRACLHGLQIRKNAVKILGRERSEKM